MLYQTFKVTFRGHFPLDMLRYDMCFPDSEEDVAIIYDSIAISPLKGTTVTLARWVRGKKELPTADRWESFLAKVSEVETR